MGKARRVESNDSAPKRRPAISIESRENQMISMAIDLAERQLLEGTASSQVITHFLKLGTTKAQLEKAKLEYDTMLVKAKTDSIQSQQRQEELFENAIKAMKDYTGHGDSDED